MMTMGSSATGIMDMRVGMNIRVGVDIKAMEMMGITIGMEINSTKVMIGMDISTTETVRRKD
jgi:hypothetical protein